MYLNNLNDEQKDLFLDVCIHAAMSNKDFAEEQKVMLQQYCMEMRLQDVRYTAKKDLEEAVNKLIDISSNTELRMIAVEVLGLLVSDKKFDEFEKEFMKDFVDRVGIEHAKITEMLTLLNELVEVYSKMNKFVFGAIGSLDIKDETESKQTSVVEYNAELVEASKQPRHNTVGQKMQCRLVALDTDAFWPMQRCRLAAYFIDENDTAHTLWKNIKENEKVEIQPGYFTNVVFCAFPCDIEENSFSNALARTISIKLPDCNSAKYKLTAKGEQYFGEWLSD